MTQDQTATPYEDSTAHLIDELSRIDVLLQRRVAALRAGDPPENRGGGLYVSDEEVDRLLGSDQTAPSAGDGTLRSRYEALTETVRRRRDRTLETGAELRQVTLAERFDLADREVDALLLALAPELDRKYERVYAYLQDDITRTRPSVGLVLDVLAESERERLAAREAFASDAPLVANRLVRLSAPDGGGSLLSNRLTVDQRIVDFLLGGDGVDPRLSDVVEAITPTTAPADLPVDDPARARIDRLAPDGPAGDGPPALRYVYGPAGVGVDAAVEAMAHLAGTTLVRADAGDLLDAGVPDPVDLLRREGQLRESALHVGNLDALEGGLADPEGDRAPGQVDRVVRSLDRFEGHVFLSGEEEWLRRPNVDNHEYVSVHLPRPGYARRRELWERHADALPEGVPADDLASTFRLTRGQIDDALRTARALENGDGVTSEAVYRGCRIQSRETLGALARRTEATYDWADIVLPEDTLAQLREVAAHVKHRGTVYSDWGFEDRFSLGNGLNVLFAGPSGTGKTMAAEIIAADAGLDMFKIDLASVVSKYIGETEENLKRIFDEAEHTDAILFFDEADALFGERSEISDSHDRYANVEVSYLLQRMEEHDGAVVLASNFKENIDDAFMRRINTTVDFPRPDRASRAEIWEVIFPEATPVGDIDVDFLSRFEITGGNIKNVALTAAFLAADDLGDGGSGSGLTEDIGVEEVGDEDHGDGDGGGGDDGGGDDGGGDDGGGDVAGATVEMTHVVRALRRELQKTGRLVDPGDFGEYQSYLE
ncbi:MAG: AAA family ATPase [Haloarculaceae archaeon]